VVIVTVVLAEQSGIGVRLLAGAHICLRRTAKGLVVGPTQRPVPLAPEKKVPQLQADFSSEFTVEVKNEFSWVPAVWEGARGAIILPRFLSFLVALYAIR
jgi:hypothetical protein